jgi:hypothetical protein
MEDGDNMVEDFPEEDDNPGTRPLSNWSISICTFSEI